MRGRPSEFKEEYIDRVDDYIKENQDEWSQFHKTVGAKSDTYERIVTVKLPTIEGFARYIGVNKTSLYEWEKKHEEFSNALDDIRQEQEQRLLENGLSGDYNPTIAKLILSSNHGYKERADVTSDDEQVKGVVVLPAKEE